MGKIIERVRAREASAKERFRKQNPLHDMWLRQQQAMSNAYNNQYSPLSENALNAALGSVNARTGEWVQVDKPPSKPWWRFW